MIVIIVSVLVVYIHETIFSLALVQVEFDHGCQFLEEGMSLWVSNGTRSLGTIVPVTHLARLGAHCMCVCVCGGGGG